MRTFNQPGKRDSPFWDAEFLEAFRRGDSRAFEQLLSRYEKPLFTFIVRMVGNRHDAEDVFQETLSRVLEKVESYDEQGKFGSWLFGIAYHLCVDRSRRKQRWKFVFSHKEVPRESLPDEDLVDPGPLPDAIVEQEELMELITKALVRLSPQQREVFLLRQHSELTFHEIAEIVRRPLNTVLGQMRSALLSIRAFLQERTK